MNEKIMKQEAQYDWLKDEVHCLNAEKKELQQRIDKAIEYIEDRFTLDKETGGYHLIHTFDSSNLYELYEILKGSDSNDNK